MSQDLAFWKKKYEDKNTEFRNKLNDCTHATDRVEDLLAEVKECRFMPSPCDPHAELRLQTKMRFWRTKTEFWRTKIGFWRTETRRSTSCSAR